MQQDMRYVYEIYRQKSFSKAAQALFITQPALSIAIGKLEASLGMPLFDRSTRPISLTPAGRIYLQTIEKTRALEQDLRHQLDDIRALRTGTITIGSSHFINACILPARGPDALQPKVPASQAQPARGELPRHGAHARAARDRPDLQLRRGRHQRFHEHARVH